MSNKTAGEKELIIPVLHEEEDFLVLNKPAGLMVHGDGRAEGPFLTDWILSKYPEAEKVGEPARDLEGNDIARPGIVHRLDRETSGAMIMAKTQKGFEFLKKQFQDRTVSKKYLAFVWGDMKDEFGTISRPIGRSGNDFRKWSAQRGARGDLREAETYWSLLSSKKIEGEDIPPDLGSNLSLVEAEPKTGRTHQIRVHFNAINHPVVGDILYAPKRPMVLGFARLALHSWKISFKGLDGKELSFKAPLPEDFAEACHRFGYEPK